MALVIEKLKKSIHAAAFFNPAVQGSPFCILWPDKDHQWEAVIPRLQKEVPELLVLGEYAPEKRTGPAIWLRCVMAGQVEETVCPEGTIPVIYLPGVSRQDLKAVEGCPAFLKPIVELQYRGAIWSQVNAKDWTILAFLKSTQGGLGLSVEQDGDSKNSMQLALNRLLDEEIEPLKGKKLDSDYFNTLITGGDPVKDLLQWIEKGDPYRDNLGEDEWRAFCHLINSQFAFDPQAKGVLAAAKNLAIHEGAWKVVWDRYCESPQRYAAIPDRIRSCKLPDFDMFVEDRATEGWPQWNDDQERLLRKDLLALRKDPPHKVRERISKLDEEHGKRRGYVWAQLGDASLAQALADLAELAKYTQNPLATGTKEDLAAGYQAFGWKADLAMLNALKKAGSPENFEAVSLAIQSIYKPWAEESARHLQDCWGNQSTAPPLAKEKAACLVFIDGLRYDCAKELSGLFDSQGCEVSELPRWAPLPTITGTGKPAVAPLNSSIEAAAENSGGFSFELMSSSQLRKSLEESGYTITEKNALRYPSPAEADKLWVELGNLDHEGHSNGWKLVKQLDALLKEIAEGVNALFDAGWPEVKIVTDHGWLLLPGGLPKVELPAALTLNKWGRCATVKTGAQCDERQFPWFWNNQIYFALASGISCYKKGEEYTHGGLSLQEGFIMNLVVKPKGGGQRGSSCSIKDVVWKGLRCKVSVEGVWEELFLDVRMQAGDKSTSLAGIIKPFKEEGTASVLIENSDLEGESAVILLLDGEGDIVMQMDTIIGGGEQ